MAGENGHPETTTEEPVLQAPPRAPRAPRRAAVPRQAEADEAPELAASRGGVRDIDLMAATRREEISVERVRASAEGGSLQDGNCGRIPARGGLGYAAEIGRRWGGGEYRISGWTSDGEAFTDTIRVPGISLSITSADDDPTIREPEPPPRRGPAFGPQGFDPYEQFQQPGFGGGGPRPQPEWYGRAFNPNSRVEIDTLKDRLKDLERALELEKLGHEKTRGELSAAREQARTELLQRQMDQRVAGLQAEIAKITAAAMARPDNSGKEFQGMFMQLMQNENAARRDMTVREEAVRREDAERQRQWLEKQSQLFVEQLRANPKQDPKELVTMVTSMVSSLTKQQSNLEQLVQMVDVVDRLRGGNEKEDDEPKSWIQEALEGASEWWKKKQQENPAQPPQLPGPGAPGQPPQSAQGEQGVDESTQIWLELIDETVGYASQNDSPHTAAHKLAQWAQKRGAQQHVRDLMANTPVQLSTKLKEKANGVPNFGPFAAIKQKLIDFASFLDHPTGAAWATEVIKVLRGGGQ